MTGQDEQLKVFIVEDEAVIAMDIGSMVLDAGHQVIGEADTYASACSDPALAEADVVLLDVQLADGSSGVDVYHSLKNKVGSIQVFLTANMNMIPAAVADKTAKMSKPIRRVSFEKALHFLADCLKRPPPASPAPDELIVGSALAERIK